MSESTRSLPRVGIIGLDPMGVAIAQRLASKCMVFVYDKSQARRDDATFNNLAACSTPWDLAVAVETVLVNLHGTDEQRTLIEKDLVRGLAAGKRVLLINPMDLVEVRRLAKDLEAKGVYLLDALISGNETRARDGNLCIYAAGAKEQCKKAAHVFKLLGGQGKVVYCGSVGAAQIVKSVEILAMALGHAAFLEALAYGVNFGAEPQQLWRALKASPAMEVGFPETMEKVLGSGGDALPVNLRELPSIAKSAKLNRHPSPMADALLEFVKDAPRKVIEHGELMPSLWTELKKGRGRTTQRIVKGS